MAIDFTLAPEHEEIQNRVRTFIQETVQPRIKGFDDEVHQMRIGERTIASHKATESTNAATGELPL